MGKNILIIGNGFDIYHKLPTRYSDFMFFASEWDTFYQTYIHHNCSDGVITSINVSLTDNGELTKEALIEFGKHGYLMNQKHVDFLNTHLQSNTWIQCFQEKVNQIHRWIDFETEIQNVLQDTEEYSMVATPMNVGKPATDGLPERLTRISTIFGDAARNGYLNFGEVEVLEYYTDKAMLQNNKEYLLEFMIQELDNLIKCLQYYLEDFVSNITSEYYSEQIINLGKVDLLNFNYTSTFQRLYGDKNINEQHAVHGGIEKENIVLGVSDDAFPNTYDYIRFQKYFQRIQKRTGGIYREFLKHFDSDKYGGYIRKHVYIFGHSLGMADYDILKLFLNHKDIEKTTIFYHDPTSYEDLIINLVKAMSKEVFIEKIGNGDIEFIPLLPAKSKV